MMIHKESESSPGAAEAALEIKNPRRILAVCLEDATQHLTRVIQDLTGSPPEAASTTLAGSTHDLALKTAYYTAVVPTWIDLIASPEEWSASFLSPEAREVLTVLGGLMLVFALPSPGSDSDSGRQATRAVIEQVGRVVKDGLGGWAWDGVGLAVGVGEGDAEEWDELCAEAGLEFVQVTGSTRDQGRNEFGEKMGTARILEALEANDWEQGEPPLSDFGDFEGGSGNGGDDGDEFDPESLDFGFDKADFEGMRMDILSAGAQDRGQDRDGGPEGASGTDNDGLRSAGEEGPSTSTTNDKKEGGGEEEGELNDDDIVQVERMMRKLQAAREAGEAMGPEQRRRMAARAVEEVMRDL